MSQDAPHTRPIQPREKLDFQLDSGVPRYWNGGDPFKTRFFDAMSLTFPIGERYFISTVRPYRDQITDPTLLKEVKDFTRQEAQHGMVHTEFNDMLLKQGLQVEWTQTFLDRKFKWQMSAWSKAFNLAYTSAAEHMTAMMCKTFMERADIIEPFDHRMRALYAWHSIEEVEHKAVCFDVLTKVAKAGYLQRCLTMLTITFGFPLTVARIMNHMFQVDGFSRWQRAKLWARGLWWFYKPGGLFIPTLGYYLAYYKPGFHPWKVKEMPSYGTWLKVFEQTGDPIAAGNALHAAGQ